ncbi:MAG: UDP-N-acetylglucosamine--N-acetylmuramyl-(pentapeptide) pyrophosphoryl-undecaprenol N-acetylglucosamine transferase [bacterium]|nr:UDP-N-acetylglucosamine--N-acetylmuramyl-(pentapeptide) pyrophosphoryl-undecaprenol N-acetylglucosamine transferase [bacterium]
MKILFTGGGSGGHFYPLIAIAEEIRRIGTEERLISPQLFFMAPDPYDERALYDNDITFVPVTTGKLRRYLSFKNITDAGKTLYGLISGTIRVFRLFPDVIVGKGGYGSFPALFAARLFNIPVLIHESDSVPGRVNRWAGKFARGVALSFPETAQYFPESKVAYTGNPIRRDILAQGASVHLGLQGGLPVLLVLGGSLGSVTLNEVLLPILPELLERFEVIHQTGQANFADLTARTGVYLAKHTFKERYHPFPSLSAPQLASAFQSATLVVSRAGSTIFEIAAWGKPSILIPITESNGNHQRENAYNYARGGGARVIEESNLTSTILLSEIERIAESSEHLSLMAQKATSFAKKDAAAVIAREILSLALAHER